MRPRYSDHSVFSRKSTTLPAGRRCLVDSPALELPPVEHETARGCSTGAMDGRALAAQDPGASGGPPSPPIGRVADQVAAHDPVAEPGLRGPVDRSARGPRRPGGATSRATMDRPQGVGAVADEDDDAVRREAATAAGAARRAADHRARGSPCRGPAPRRASRANASEPLSEGEEPATSTTRRASGWRSSATLTVLWPSVTRKAPVTSGGELGAPSTLARLTSEKTTGTPGNRACRFSSRKRRASTRIVTTTSIRRPAYFSRRRSTSLPRREPPTCPEGRGIRRGGRPGRRILLDLAPEGGFDLGDSRRRAAQGEEKEDRRGGSSSRPLAPRGTTDRKPDPQGQPSHPIRVRRATSRSRCQRRSPLSRGSIA